MSMEEIQFDWIEYRFKELDERRNVSIIWNWAIYSFTVFLAYIGFFFATDDKMFLNISSLLLVFSVVLFVMAKIKSEKVERLLDSEYKRIAKKYGGK